MSKRYSNFNQPHNKRPKLEDQNDELWGDDIDENVIDDFFKLVSQVDEEEKISCTQLNNVTLLSTYSAFKARDAEFTSTQITQINNNVRPGTSKNNVVFSNVVSAKDLEEKVRQLQQNCEEKEGQVSILKVQLQETKAHLQAEQQKIHSEWSQKLTQTEKRMNSVKSELEFKNLEIANLKQQIIEITKRNIFDSNVASPQKSTYSKVKEKKVASDKVDTKTMILRPILEPVYPLKGVLSDTIFNIPKKELHTTQAKYIHNSQNTIPYLQNQLISTNIIINKSDFDIETLYHDVLKIIWFRQDEFDAKENLRCINKVIYACEQFLYDLEIFLSRVKDNLSTEDILEADSSYLKISSNVTYKEEIGIKSSALLNFVAEIIVYSEYLRKYVCQDEKLSCEDDEIVQKLFPYKFKTEQNRKSHFLLNTTLHIIRTAAEIRKTTFLTGFLCATIKLLINIHKTGNYKYVTEIFCNLTKEVILSRPQIDVIRRTSFLLKEASHQPSFIEFLLNKSQKSVKSNKGLLYFNADACRFYIFVMLYDNAILRGKDEDFTSDVCLNLLCFMYGTFKNCHWIHHKNTKECECVPQLYKLVVEIIGRALDKYTVETKKLHLISNEWWYLFRNPIVAKILNLMTFHSYEMTEKYITVFAQYKEIEKQLHEDENVIQLEKLNIIDDVIQIPSKAFNKIDF